MFWQMLMGKLGLVGVVAHVALMLLLSLREQELPHSNTNNLVHNRSGSENFIVQIQFRQFVKKNWLLIAYLLMG